MGDRESTLYYIIPEGASQEETCTWEEIEAFCEAGRLSPNSLIYLPETQNWEKVINTDLISCFDSDDDSAKPAGDSEVAAADLERLEAEYDAARGEIHQSPDLPRSYLNAAAAALALGDREAAMGFYQQATELQPFNKSIATEIKRNLRAEETGRIRLLERPESAWDDVGRLAAFPLARGPWFFLVPAAVLAALALIPKAGGIVAAVLTWLWVYRAADRVSDGAAKPPHWREFVSEPVTAVVRPVLTGLLVALELAAPFCLFAGVVILVGDSPRPELFQFIQDSAAMMVLLWVAGIVYLPAVLTLAVTPGIRFWDPLNIVKNARAMMAMDYEFITGLAYFFGFGVLWGGLIMVLGRVPVAGVVLPVITGLYGLLITAFMLGRLSARCRHLWTGGPARPAGKTSADPQQFIDIED